MTTVLLDKGIVRLKLCRHGHMLFLATDTFIGRSLDFYGEYCEGEAAIFREAVRPGQTVLDIGANVGPHSVVFAKAVGAQGTVLAFEPQRVLFQMLCANAAMNGFGNIHTYQAVVGSGNGEMVLPRIDYTRGGNFGGVTPLPEGEGETVPVTTVDSLGLEACHFIKIDVEGMESEVLAGATDTITRLRPLLYVENDRPAKSKALLTQLMALDYRLYWHCPTLYVEANFFGNTRNIFSNLRAHNVICLPRERPQSTPNMIEVTSPDDPVPFTRAASNGEALVDLAEAEKQ
jgi:FkbM family methyltransferase